MAIEMKFNPKPVEINEEFFAVYPPSEMEEARQAQENGWNVLIESTDATSGNTRLDEPSLYDYREAHKK